MTTQKPDHFVLFGPFYSYKTDHLKTEQFEYQNQEVSGSSNGQDFGFLHSDVDYIGEVLQMSRK